MLLAVGEADPGQPAGRDPLGLGPGAALDLGQAEHDVVERGHVREQVEALEDHADPGALGRDRALAQPLAPAAGEAIADRLAVDHDLALVVLLEQVDAAQQRGLARAAGADDRHDFALADLEVDALEDLGRAEALVDVVRAQHRGRVCSAARLRFWRAARHQYLRYEKRRSSRPPSCEIVKLSAT